RTRRRWHTTGRCAIIRRQNYRRLKKWAGSAEAARLPGESGSAADPAAAPARGADRGRAARACGTGEAAVGGDAAARNQGRKLRDPAPRRMIGTLLRSRRARPAKPLSSPADTCQLRTSSSAAPNDRKALRIRRFRPTLTVGL